MSDPRRAGEEPVIEVRGLRNSFGEQVVHEGLDLTVRFADRDGPGGDAAHHHPFEDGLPSYRRITFGLERPGTRRRGARSGAVRRRRVAVLH